ncbi:hypothetical protein AB0M38_13400 [Streptomyces sp. NPDC051742]|uniref:hypothetical protein n=1 Tax=unclassified Streptomyces TaxID=2593676 RepID=UPI00344296AC
MTPSMRISPLAHVVQSWSAAVWLSQISARVPATLEARSASRKRPDPVPRRRAVLAASGLPQVILNTAAPCAGTLAEIWPEGLDVPPVHRSVRANDPPMRLTCAAAAVMVVGLLPC